MSEETHRGLGVLTTLVRKQEWDIAELSSGLARAKELCEKLSEVADALDLKIGETESCLRPSAGGELSVDVIQRHRQFLGEQRVEAAKVRQERQRAEAIIGELASKLTELRVKKCVYEKLADRRRKVLAIEEEKVQMRSADDLWLLKRGGEG